MNPLQASVWTVYSLKEIDGYFARKWVLKWGPPPMESEPTRETLNAATLEELRALIPQGYHRHDRAPMDAKEIVETWASWPPPPKLKRWKRSTPRRGDKHVNQRHQDEIAAGHRLARAFWKKAGSRRPVDG